MTIDPASPTDPTALRPVDLLPHRDPFLLVTDILEVIPGVSARCQWVLSGEEMFWPGHFPGRPTLPGVLMIEALAQTGAIALMADEQFSTKLALFGGVDGVRFRRQVVPGETLELVVTLGQMSSRMGKGHGKATVAGKTACEADLLFVLADR
jgi:3-hydroxyacyl-[acyl-carrier-protein] dehydratase